MDGFEESVLANLKDISDVLFGQGFQSYLHFDDETYNAFVVRFLLKFKDMRICCMDLRKWQFVLRDCMSSFSLFKNGVKIVVSDFGALLSYLDESGIFYGLVD